MCGVGVISEETNLNIYAFDDAKCTSDYVVPTNLTKEAQITSGCYAVGGKLNASIGIVCSVEESSHSTIVVLPSATTMMLLLLTNYIWV